MFELQKIKQIFTYLTKNSKISLIHFCRLLQICLKFRYFIFIVHKTSCYRIEIKNKYLKSFRSEFFQTKNLKFDPEEFKYAITIQKIYKK